MRKKAHNKPESVDKNFDTLAKTFSRNIYDSPKGQIRVEVLLRDLKLHTPLEQRKLRILDAGGGFGYLSQQLAAMGHEVVLCDISKELLDKAREQINQSEQALDIQLIHGAIQELDPALGKFDLILCHAVLEWLADGEQVIAGLKDFLTADGQLSLMFFNRDALLFHALVNGNFEYVANDLKAKKTVKLNPNHPQTLANVSSWFNNWQMPIVCQSGVRIMNDYMRRQLKEGEFATLLEYELKYSSKPEFVSVGRYIHLIANNQ
ncbi:methyltransferase [Paraferrimonas sp. SM1919]|uniref:methyltransferase n=1 Tax=Paraferrimonas sp. SM1919 TaxID=2662263 RepID=UPI0013D04FC5|nr:methyltransferase [Paraferrimonas sp. SM1919]